MPTISLWERTFVNFRNTTKESSWDALANSKLVRFLLGENMDSIYLRQTVMKEWRRRRRRRRRKMAEGK